MFSSIVFAVAIGVGSAVPAVPVQTPSACSFEQIEPPLLSQDREIELSTSGRPAACFQLWSTIEGELYVACGSGRLAVELTAETGSGYRSQALNADAPARTAFLVVPVGRGEQVSIHLHLAHASGPGKLHLRIASASETTRSLELEDLLRAGTEDILRLTRDGDTKLAAVVVGELGKAVLKDPGLLICPKLSAATVRFADLAGEQGALSLSVELLRAVCDVRRQQLPETHQELLRNRHLLALRLHLLGHLDEARREEGDVLALCESALPMSVPIRRESLHHYALIHRSGRDYDAAADLLGSQLAWCEAELPPDDHELRKVRGRLATVEHLRGDEERALELIRAALAGQDAEASGLVLSMRLDLAEILSSLRDADHRRAIAISRGVLAAWEGRSAPDTPEVQRAKLVLGRCLRLVGELQEAVAVQSELLESLERTRPDWNDDLQAARQDLASTLYDMGSLAEACELWERALAVYLERLPEDDGRVLSVRNALAMAAFDLGDLERARELQEAALAATLRSLPEDDDLVQSVRLNLARTLSSLGDELRALELRERALAHRAARLPEDDPRLLLALSSLAASLQHLGDWDGAWALQEDVLERLSRTLPAGHDRIQYARLDLAQTLGQLGHHAAAAELEAAALEARSALYAEGDLALAYSRGNLAVSYNALGRPGLARELQESVLASFERAFAEQHPDLHKARLNLACTCALLGDWEAAAGYAREVACGVRASLDQAALLESPRELQAYAQRYDFEVSCVISLALGMPDEALAAELRAEAFELIETLRSGPFQSAAISRLVLAAPELDGLRRSLRKHVEDFVAALGGSTTGTEVARLRDEVERAQREAMQRYVQGHAWGLLAPRLSSSDVRRILEPGALAMGFWRFRRLELPESGPWVPGGPAHMAVFLLSSDRSVQLIDLGDVELLEQEVSAWRKDLLAGGGGRTSPSGARLAERMLAPVRDALLGVHRVIVACDDVLHTIPLEALPWEGDYFGAGFRVEFCAGFWELSSPWLDEDPGAGLLVAGDLDYDPAPEGLEPEDGSSSPTSAALPEWSTVRSGEWAAGFRPLPETAEELQVIGDLYSARFGDEATVLRGGELTRKRFVESSREQRILHLATHAYYSLDSIARSLEPGEEGGGSPQAAALPSAERVRRMNPMTLCGLALSGANGEGGRFGRLTGVLTAEDIAALDLSRCELAVLSACGTSQGELRPLGLGTASLQRAFQLAGARSTVTSLWHVDDAMTRELMQLFYDGVWRDGVPSRDALWQAKMELDDRSVPPREWAAWVLTGLRRP